MGNPLEKNEHNALTDDEREFLRLVKKQAAERGVDSVEYCKTMIDALEAGTKKYPGDEQKIHEHLSAFLNEKYPIVKEGGAV